MNPSLYMRSEPAKRIEHLFVYFILLQPVLDISAYFDLLISDLFRLLAMGLGAVYIVLHPKAKKKKTLLYFIVLIVFIVLHLSINVWVKAPFHSQTELTYTIKTAFFPEMVIVYALVTLSFCRQRNEQTSILRFIPINIGFISAIMLLATLTDSGNRTYGALAKAGHSGWFFSGNELSAIMAMGFPIIVLSLLTVNSLAKKCIILPLVGIVIWSMLTIGTKVSFGAVLISLVTAVFASSINAMRNKKNRFDLTLVSLLFIITILVMPETPIGNNLNVLLIPHEDESTGEVEQDDVIKTKPQLLSGRRAFLEQLNEQYRRAPFIQKMFGMGYGGNFVDEPKLVEMDAIDLFFNFGLIGIIILLLPVLYIGYRIIANIIYTRLTAVDQPLLFTGLSVGLGFGTAFVAGHVVSAPAASIYLAALLSHLLVLSEKRQKST